MPSISMAAVHVTAGGDSRCCMRPIQWSSGSRVNVIHKLAIGVAVDHLGLAGERQPVLVPEPLVLGIDVGHREVEHDLAAELGVFRHAQVQPHITAGEERHRHARHLEQQRDAEHVAIERH